MVGAAVAVDSPLICGRRILSFPDAYLALVLSIDDDDECVLMRALTGSLSWFDARFDVSSFLVVILSPLLVASSGIPVALIADTGLP